MLFVVGLVMLLTIAKVYKCITYNPLLFKIAAAKFNLKQIQPFEKCAVLDVRDGSSERVVFFLFTNALCPIMNSVIAHKEESHDKMNCLIGQTIIQIVFIPKAYLLICLMHFST